MTLDETFKAAKAGDLTNDTTYKVGEISRKTGLQKQPDGSWAPPKTGTKTAASSETQNSAAAFKGKSINNFKDYAKANGLRMYTAAPGSNGPDSTVERYTDSRNLHTVFVNYDDKTGQITSVEENFRKLTLPETKGHSPRGVDKLMVEAGYEAAGWDEANSESKWKDETGEIVKVHFDRFGHADKVTKNATSSEPKKSMSNVNHNEVDMARNKMNTTPAEDQMLDYFVTEMHEDRTSLKEIIERQDGIYERSNGAYPKEEKTYKSLRAKLLDQFAMDSAPTLASIFESVKKQTSSQDAAYTAESVNAPRENLESKLTGDCKIRIRK